MAEPWLRGTLGEIHPVLRAVVHALEQAKEDLLAWTADLGEEELWVQPHGLAPVAFQLRHIAGSIDRLLTYADGVELAEAQLNELRGEMNPGSSLKELRALAAGRLLQAEARVREVDPARLEEPRWVGKKRLPTTLAGLLIHTAEHTQRHVGQLIITVRVLRDLRTPGQKRL
ncbi:MAG TPA: DinB family protein [Paludibaculum sp.]|jgi:uncharacterized damage-inducible protein DinB